MEHKKVNWAFLGFVVLEMITMVALIIGIIFGSSIDLNNIFVSTLLAEGIILAPFLIITIMDIGNISFAERVGMKSMRIPTMLLVVLYAFVIMPIGTFVNAISMMFVDNTMLENSGSMLNSGVYAAVVATAFVAPFVEELVFRGYVFNGYRRDGARISAVFLSALAFAFMHMNFNQAAYALVVGIAFALVYEATGSLWSSFICHMLFNAESVISMFWTDAKMPGIYDDIKIDRTEIATSLPIYAVAAVVAIIIAGILVVKIASLEGRKESFIKMFDTDYTGEKKAKIMTWPMFIGLMVCLAVMILDVL